MENIVDPLDAEYAISTILGVVSDRGMSKTDLALELGWRTEKVEDILDGECSLSFKDLNSILSVLNIEIDLE